MTHTIAPVLGEATVQELREAVRGEVVTPGRRRLRRGLPGLERRARRPPAGARRPLRRRRRRDRRGRLRAQQRPADRRPRRRPQHRRLLDRATTGSSIDLSQMNDVRVDPAARRATVGGGAVWADVDHETQAHGLATTGGLVSTTGVAGFTLGGGIGWTMRKFGLACDNLVGADVVTADGRLVHASETENADLLWGLRGGGGNFGIVTQFEFELHPLGPMVYAGPIFYPADAARDLLRAFREWAAGAPDEITALVNLTTAPPLPVIPAEWHGKKVAALIAVSTGPVEEGERLVARAPRRSPSRSPTCSARCPTSAIQTLIDPLWPKGDPRVLQGDEPRAARRRADRPALRSSTSTRPARSARSTSTRWAARSPASPRARPHSPSARCRSCSTRSPAGTTRRRGDAHATWARAVIAAAADASTGRAYVNFLGDAGRSDGRPTARRRTRGSSR